MTVLAFDTSTTGCSAAVIASGDVLSSRFEVMERGQAERLMPMVDAVMQEAGQSFDDLSLIATTVGPGAFTGLRIGLAAAQAFCLAANKPGAGITTFDGLLSGFLGAEAIAAPPHETIVVTVESKREDVFVQVFGSDGMVLGEARALPPSAIAGLLPPGAAVLLGDAAERCLQPLIDAGLDASIATGPGLVNAVDLGRLAERRFNAGGRFLDLTPIYLRGPDAKVPKDGGMLRPPSPPGPPGP